MTQTIRFVIGLGNPGKNYKNSPHNLGRMLVERAQELKEFSWKKETAFCWGGVEPSFVMLNDYMNQSGISVGALIKKFGCETHEILVCTDDFDIPFGSIRIRKKGSGGSHNGLKSIVEQLGSGDFPRLRLGIGPLPPQTDPAVFVLKPFSKEDRPVLEKTLEKALLAIDAIVSDGLEKAMNQFNTQKLTAK